MDDSDKYSPAEDSNSRDNSSDNAAAKLSDLAHLLHAVAKQLSGLARPQISEPQHTALSPERLPARDDIKAVRRRNAQQARRFYQLRRRRAALFGNPDLFGEPAWDILLDLYVAFVDGVPISVSSACIGSAAPPTTGLRWLGVLAHHGLISRRHDHHDHRRVLVHLTEKGIAAMDGFFEELLEDEFSQSRSRTD